jgi:hypothetical protein
MNGAQQGRDRSALHPGECDASWGELCPKQLALLAAAMCAITTIQHGQLLQLPRTATSISGIQKQA